MVDLKENLCYQPKSQKIHYFMLGYQDVNPSIFVDDLAILKHIYVCCMLLLTHASSHKSLLVLCVIASAFCQIKGHFTHKTEGP